jgi:hypothetical protein
MTSKRMVVIMGIVFTLALIGAAVAYVQLAKPAWIVGTKATPTPSPAATPTPVPKALGASVTPTPTPPPEVALAARDAERQAALAGYAASYRKYANKSGFYPVNPPDIQVGYTDPTTTEIYAITKTIPKVLGQIRYWAGGSCTGKAVKPGPTSTKYLALQVLLESTPTPYCLDVIQ